MPVAMPLFKYLPKSLSTQSDAALCFKYYFWDIFIHKMKPYTSNKFFKGTNHFDFTFIVSEARQSKI